MKGGWTALICGLAMACTATGGGTPGGDGSGLATTPAPPMPGPDACGAAALQRLVGRPASDLTIMKFRGPMRTIRPGQAVTMDFSAERLNIEIDASETILRVFCG